MADSTGSIAQTALEIASAVSDALPPPWNVAGTALEVISDILPFFFPDASEDGASVDQVITVIAQAFEQQDIYEAVSAIATTAHVFASYTAPGALDIKFPASVNDALKNHPGDAFAQLYTFLQNAIGGIDESALLEPITSMESDASGDVSIQFANKQAYFLSTFAYGVSVYVLLASYWISLAVSTDGPIAAIDMDVDVPINNLADAGLSDNSGWIQYATAAVDAFSQLVEDRLGQVSPVTPGTFGIHEISVSYFADEGTPVTNLNPSSLGGTFEVWTGPGASTYTIDTFVGWPGNFLSYMPADTNAVFAVYNPFGQDQSGAVQPVREAYCELMRQTLYNNYFDPGAMTQTIQGWTTALAKLQYATYRLYLFYAGSGGSTNIWMSLPAQGEVSDGTDWQAPNSLEPGINTATAPSPVICNFSLYVFYKGIGADTNIYIAHPGVPVFDGSEWSATVLQAGINTTCAPAAICWQNSIYLFYKGTNTLIYIAEAQNNDVDVETAWSLTPLEAGINTCDTPAPVVFDGKMYLFYRGLENAIYLALPPADGDVADGSNWTAMLLELTSSTIAAPAAVAFRNALYVFFTAGDNICVATPASGDVTNGSAWSTTVLDGISSAYAPAPVVYNGELHLFFTGSDSYIYVAQPPTAANVATGSAWVVNRLNDRITTNAAPSVAVL